MQGPDRPFIPEEETLPNREVKGFNYKQAGAAITAVIILEFSVLGIYFGIKDAIKDLSMGNALRDQKIEMLQNKVERLEDEFRNLDKRQSNVEFQLSDTYSQRQQKKYDTQ